MKTTLMTSNRINNSVRLGMTTYA